MGREGFEPSKAEPADLQSAPFGHLGTDPSADTIVAGASRSASRIGRPGLLACLRAELRCHLRGRPARGAQRRRPGEPRGRHPFRLQGHRRERRAQGTRDPAERTHRGPPPALVQVLEEKLVRRQVSLKALSYGKIEEAARGALRQTVDAERRHLVRPRQEDQQDRQGPQPQGRPVPDPGRPGPCHRQEAGRPPGGDRGAEGGEPRHPAPVRQLPRLRSLSRRSRSARTGRARLRTRTSRGWQDRPRLPGAIRNRTPSTPRSPPS